MKWKPPPEKRKSPGAVATAFDQIAQNDKKQRRAKAKGKAT